MLLPFKWIKIILGLTGLILAESGKAGKITQNSMNKFADAVLLRIRENLVNKSLEPILVPRVGPLEEGLFSGLVTIQRNGDAELVVKGQAANDTISFSAILPENARLVAPCRVTFFGRDVCDGGATFRFRGLMFDLVFRSVPTEGNLPHLAICDVSDLGKMSVRFGKKDSGMLTTALSWMGYWFSPLLKSRMTSTLQDILCNAIASSV